MTCCLEQINSKSGAHQMHTNAARIQSAFECVAQYMHSSQPLRMPSLLDVIHCKQLLCRVFSDGTKTFFSVTEPIFFSDGTKLFFSSDGTKTFFFSVTEPKTLCSVTESFIL